LLFQEDIYWAKGAVEEGELYQDDDIAFGPALVHAYELQEYNAIYPRFILTQELTDRAVQTIENKQDRDTVFDILTTDFSDMFVHIHYIRNLALKLFAQGDLAGLQNILSKIQHKIMTVLLSESDKQVRSQFKWLMDYFNDTLNELEPLSVHGNIVPVRLFSVQYHFN
jgi:hypothetical protein